MTQRPSSTDHSARRAFARGGPARPGVEAIPSERLEPHWGPAVASLGLDARLAWRWARRGPLVTSPYVPILLRRRLLRLAGIEVARTVDGLVSCWFETADVAIGEGTYVGPRAWFEGSGRIQIGTDCLLGPEVMLVTSTHPRLDDGGIARAVAARPVQVGSGCWIGARSTILPGVQIGEGAVIGAGAVVTTDCDAAGTYAGVPARRVR